MISILSLQGINIDFMGKSGTGIECDDTGVNEGRKICMLVVGVSGAGVGPFGGSIVNMVMSPRRMPMAAEDSFVGE